MKSKLTLNDIAIRISLGLNVAVLIWLAYGTYMSGVMIRTRMLVLKDSSGETRIMLSAMAGEAAILMNGDDGSTSLSFWVSPLGYPSFTLKGPNGNPAVEISTVSQGGGAQISLFNDDGERVWQVMVDDSGQPRVIERAEGG